MFHRTFSALPWIGLGAGLMFLLDPRLGNRRRALLRDQLVHYSNKLGDVLSGEGENLGNRIYGLYAELRYRSQPEPVADGTIVARVRGELGHVASAPGAIFVTSENGQVTLTGSAPEDEINRILSVVANVPGVQSVDNQLVLSQESGLQPESSDQQRHRAA
ncbi:MAG: BON domain-containing protein [Chloroflexi bacterium]|nr:BON domain-containing protein [Chloroflexota bacterium]